MPRYADPSRCPDCGVPLPVSPSACPRCALPLQGPLASELLSTLAHADGLLVQLRVATLAPVGAAVGATAGAALGPRATDLPAYPSTPAQPRRSGLTAASVPKILLGLGALALLVAAVIFLSVAWSFLGIGGRTAVLVALTVATAWGGLQLHGRDLRIAGEALVTVSLGLLCLDVLGAADAGWLGDADVATICVVLGAALLAACGVLLALGDRLVVPQVVAPIGASLVGAGVLGLAPTAPAAVAALLAASVLAHAALAALGRRARLDVLLWAGVVAAATWWSGLVLVGLLASSGHADLQGLWVDGHGYALLLSAPLALLPLAAVSSRDLRIGCVATAASLATLAVGVVWTDDGPTVLLVASLALLLGWAAVAFLAPASWRTAAWAPLALVAVPVLTTACWSLAVAAARVLSVGDPYSSAADLRLQPAQPLVESMPQPLLLVPSVLALAIGLLALRAPSVRRVLPVPGAVAVSVAAAATLALHEAPLWAPVLTLSLAGAALLGLAAIRESDRTAAVAAALGLAALAVVAGLPSDLLATTTAAVLAALAVGVLVVARLSAAHDLADLVLPVGLAAALWSAGELAGVDAVDRAVPILLVVGVLAVVLPRLGLEASAVVVGALAAAASVGSADEVLTALAVHLTVAGTLVTISGLVHPGRRLLVRAGGVLLAGATWARLADLGVTAPEAYTLPLAAVLLALGVRRLLAEPAAGTVTTLLPGLLLATVPSLLWVLDDPVTLRAALLGLGCLAVLFTGTRLRWTAPVLVGAVVGGLLVLRELAPYAAQTPQWVVIGLTGTLLTVVGVTWERRLRDLQSAGAYLDRLR